MAAKKKDAEAVDPVISTESVVGDGYPEGTHPARPVDEVTLSASRFEYREMEDKPDPSTVAQVQIVDGE